MQSQLIDSLCSLCYHINEKDDYIATKIKQKYGRQLEIIYISKRPPSLQVHRKELQFKTPSAFLYAHLSFPLHVNDTHQYDTVRLQYLLTSLLIVRNATIA